MDKAASETVKNEICQANDGDNLVADDDKESDNNNQTAKDKTKQAGQAKQTAETWQTI